MAQNPLAWPEKRDSKIGRATEVGDAGGPASEPHLLALALSESPYSSQEACIVEQIEWVMRNKSKMRLRLMAKLCVCVCERERVREKVIERLGPNRESNRV